ncbi:MAG: glycosyltransferase [Candidatus Xenobium sp.]|jgi:MGT family glycosyltransferase|nr:glycosyltransferase family 1 protein [Burkholderiales bacterium]
MAGILVYTAPTRGHLYPLVPTLETLLERGHDLFVHTAGAEVRTLRELGCEARPLADTVEFAIRNDWQHIEPEEALHSLLLYLVDRGSAEAEDLQRAIEVHQPDLLVVDIHAFGALACAETCGLPWASWSATLLPFPAPGIPPFGLGLPRSSGALGAVKNWAKANSVQKAYDQALPQFNALRESLGASPLNHLLNWPTIPPRLLYFTAEPFEYPRQWPESVRLIGPGNWEPFPELLDLEEDSRPLVLVSCSTEFQNDGHLAGEVLEALSREKVRVLVTTASVDPEAFSPPPNNARVVRFAAHGPLIAKAACVVCPGGMGLVQKSLSAGVPVLAVPFGRDQIEVARRIENLKAGVSLPASRMTPSLLCQGVHRAMECRRGAVEVQLAFRQCGGAQAAADLLEEMLPPLV